MAVFQLHSAVYVPTFELINFSGFHLIQHLRPIDYSFSHNTTLVLLQNPVQDHMYESLATQFLTAIMFGSLTVYFFTQSYYMS